MSHSVLSWDVGKYTESMCDICLKRCVAFDNRAFGKKGNHSVVFDLGPRYKLCRSHYVTMLKGHEEQGSYRVLQEDTKMICRACAYDFNQSIRATRGNNVATTYYCDGHYEAYMLARKNGPYSVSMIKEAGFHDTWERYFRGDKGVPYSKMPGEPTFVGEESEHHHNDVRTQSYFEGTRGRISPDKKIVVVLEPESDIESRPEAMKALMDLVLHGYTVPNPLVVLREGGETKTFKELAGLEQEAARLSFDISLNLKDKKVVYDQTKSGEDIVRHYDTEGQLHKEDGPAVVWPNGTGYYYIHGKRLSPAEWEAYQVVRKRHAWDVSNVNRVRDLKELMDRIQEGQV